MKKPDKDPTEATAPTPRGQANGRSGAEPEARWEDEGGSPPGQLSALPADEVSSEREKSGTSAVQSGQAPGRSTDWATGANRHPRQATGATQETPWAALGVAVGVGLLLGVLLSRR